MVLKDDDISRCKTRVDAIGFDALSSYGIGGGFSISFIRWWNSAIQSSRKVVILLPTGWDPRPRSEHPLLWVDQGPEHFLQPTAKELQNFAQSSIQLEAPVKR
ncbi:unnamed protein product [Adineta steineri]|uniref:Uncharacterized protein n=1 Tax=Adineta steineri TaxID=433720 RepID=A0A813RIU7_9BILA|nr:unnamed protein product [Adineta steineri]